MTIEDMLVADVLDGVGTGRIELGRSGGGTSPGNGGVSGIEAPYLQLVMQRLWDVERSKGSATLRAETLAALGGAGQVVADHLERAIEALTPAQRDIAALLFDHLVTPSGMKIAHEARTSRSSRARARTRFAVSWESSQTIASSARTRPGGGRSSTTSWPMPCSGWKTRYEAERAVALARADARRRHRRLAFFAFGALVALAGAGALAVFAFSQRSEAREQARSAQSGQGVASALAVLGRDPELGIALALEAARIEPTPRVEDALRQALDASRVRDVISTGHPVVGMDVDPSGRRVLAVGDDRRARVYELATGELLWSHRVDGAAAAFLARTPSSWCPSRSWRHSTRRRGGSAGRPSPSRCPASWKSSFRARTERRRSRSSASRGRVRSTWQAVPGSAASSTFARSPTPPSGRAGDSLRAADATARGASGAREPGARLGCLSWGTAARCSVSRSTGSAPGSPPGAPIRPGVSGGHGQDGCSPRCSGTRAT